MQQVGVGGSRWTTPVVAYLVAQAVLTLAWWALLRWSPTGREAFELAPQRVVLDAFVLADLAVFVIGSLASALAIHRGWAAASAVVWFTAGGVVSATTFLVALVLHVGSQPTGVVPMVAASIATVAVAFLTAPPARVAAVAR